MRRLTGERPDAHVLHGALEQALPARPRLGWITAPADRRARGSGRRGRRRRGCSRRSCSRRGRRWRGVCGAAPPCRGFGLDRNAGHVGQIDHEPGDALQRVGADASPGGEPEEEHGGQDGAGPLGGDPGVGEERIEGGERLEPLHERCLRSAPAKGGLQLPVPRREGDRARGDRLQGRDDERHRLWLLQRVDDGSQRRDADAGRPGGDGRRGVELEAARGEPGDLPEVPGLLLRKRALHLRLGDGSQLDEDLSLRTAGARHPGEALPQRVHVDEPGREQGLTERLEPPEGLRADGYAVPEEDARRSLDVMDDEDPRGALVEHLEEDGREWDLGQIAGLVEEGHRGGILHRVHPPRPARAARFSLTGAWGGTNIEARWPASASSTTLAPSGTSGPLTRDAACGRSWTARARWWTRPPRRSCEAPSSASRPVASTCWGE